MLSWKKDGKKKEWDNNDAWTIRVRKKEKMKGEGAMKLQIDR